MTRSRHRLYKLAYLEDTRKYATFGSVGVGRDV